MAIQIPVVSSCLGCISLRTGTKLFGFLYLVVSIFFIIYEVFILVHWGKTGPDEEFKEAVPYICLELVLLSIHATTSVLLLMGAYQENHLFIPPWLVSTVIMAVASVFSIAPSTYHIYVAVSGGHPYKDLLVAVISLVDDVYGFLVVYGYYRTLSPQRQVGG